MDRDFMTEKWSEGQRVSFCDEKFDDIGTVKFVTDAVLSMSYLWKTHLLTYLYRNPFISILSIEFKIP